jgi:hypothetical protein
MYMCFLVSRIQNDGKSVQKPSTSVYYDHIITRSSSVEKSPYEANSLPFFTLSKGWKATFEGHVTRGHTEAPPLSKAMPRRLLPISNCASSAPARDTG